MVNAWITNLFNKFAGSPTPCDIHLMADTWDPSNLAAVIQF